MMENRRIHVSLLLLCIAVATVNRTESATQAPDTASAPAPAAAPDTSTKIPKDCGDPSGNVTVNNGNVSAEPSSTTVNSTANITCNEGYETNAIFTCQNNGSWSPPFITCKVKDCGNPSGNVTVNNGAVSPGQSPTTVNSTANITCNEGYETNETFTCQNNGSWSPPFITCHVKDCGNPSGNVTVNNGAVSPGQSPTTVNSTANITCNEGYETNEIFTCQNNGSWSPPLITCQMKDCGNPSGNVIVNNGAVSPGQSPTTVNSTANITCNEGYESNEIFTCQNNGSWSPPFITCHVKDCGNPSGNVTVNNGAVSPGQSPTTVNSTANITCNEGYETNEIFTCQNNGSWSPPLITCQMKDCGEPSGNVTVNNGTVSPGQSPTTVNSTANITCNEGYETNEIFTCQNNGSWSPPFITCKVKDCGNASGIVKVINGHISPEQSPTTVNSTISITCNIGYETSKLTTCQSNGSWSPTSISCQLKGVKYNDDCNQENPPEQCVTHNAVCINESNGWRCQCNSSTHSYNESRDTCDTKYNMPCDPLNDTCETTRSECQASTDTSQHICTCKQLFEYFETDNSCRPAFSENTNLTVQTVGEDWLNVSIINGCTNDSYVYTMYLSSGAKGTISCSDNPDTSVIQFRDLQAGTEYNVDLILMIDDVRSGTNLTLSQYTKPRPPGTPFFSNITETTLMVTWAAPTEGKVDDYNVWLEPDTVPTQSTNTSEVFQTFNNLTQSTNYTVHVQSVLRGLYSIEVTSSHYTAPALTGTVLKMYEDNIFERRLDVKLSGACGEGKDAYTYYVYQRDAGAQEKYECSKEGNTLFSFVNLTPGTNYTFDLVHEVYGVRSVTNKTLSQFTRPQPPDNINITNVTNDYIDVDWGFDTEPNGTYDGFKLVVSSKPNSTYGKNITSVSLLKLVGGTNYNISVYTFIADSGAVTELLLSQTAASSSNCTNPNPPHAHTVNVQEETFILISYNATDDIIDHYSVTFNGTNTTFPSGVKTMTTLNVTGLHPGTNYTFRVWSLTCHKQSLTFDTIDTYTRPGQPSSIHFNSISDTELNVTWSAPDRGHVDSYKVWLVKGTDYRNETSTTTTQMFSGILSATEYTLIVQTVWRDLTSVTTNMSSFTAPKDPTVEPFSITDASLSFNITEPEKGVLYNFTLQDTRTLSIKPYKQGTFVQFNDLVAGRLYELTVTATIGGISNLHSVPRQFRTNPSTVRNISLNHTYTTSDTMCINWTNPEGDFDSLTYKCNCTSPNKGQLLQSNGTLSNLTSNANCSGLDPGTFCTVDIIVYSGQQAGLPSAQTLLKSTREKAPSSATKIFNITSSRTLNLSWSRPESPNGVIRKYMVTVEDVKGNCNVTRINRQYQCTDCLDESFSVGEQCEDSQNVIKQSTENDTFNFSSKTITAAFNDLIPGRNYTVSIVPYTKCWGNITLRDVLTKEEEPNRVKNLNGTNTTTDSILLTWKKPCPANGIIRYYKVNVNHIDTSNTTSFCTNTTDENVTVKQLLPYRNYTIGVAAINDAGMGEFLNSKTLQTKIGAPYKIGGIKTANKTSSSVKVQWNPPSLYTGPTWYNVTSYDVYHGIVSTYRIDGFNSSIYNIRNLKAYWNYTIKVTAITQAGQNESKQIEERTAEDVPGSITDLRLQPEVDVTKPRGVTVTWAEPDIEDRNGVITGYNIRYGYTEDKMVFHSFIKGSSKVIYNASITDLSTGKIIVQVSANTSQGEGTTAAEKVVLTAGAPLKINESGGSLLMQKSSQGVSDTKKQISILLPLASFLCNKTNGHPNMWGLVVSEASAATDIPFNGLRTDFETKKIETYHRWSDIKDADVIRPYVSTAEIWNPCGFGRRRRSDTNTTETKKPYTVGTDGKCDGYCNGELAPGRSYRVRGFVCTEGGCTESEYSQPITTDPDLTVPIAAGVSSGIVVIVAIIIVITVMRRRKSACFAKTADRPEVSDITDGNATEMTETQAEYAFKPGPVQLSNFPDMVDDMHRDTDLLFSSAFNMVKDKSPKCSTSMSETQACRPKNRYTNILSFDHSRVKLLPLDDVEGTDYINANYIPGHRTKRGYIATQGPLPSTFDDFWRMVWEQNVSVIVMLTKLVEKGRSKCDKYWPTVGEPVYYGDLVASTQSESTLPAHTLRVIELKLKDKTRKVCQFSYLKWPDMGCPDHPSMLLEFVEAVRNEYKPEVAEKGPMIVHCSAGVGRTGTFIAVDTLLQHVKENDSVDIYNLVMEMRRHRNNMVQTEDQFVYIYECLKEYIMTDEDEGEDEDPVYENTTTNENVYENYGFK